jgi:hypothetical protein
MLQTRISETGKASVRPQRSPLRSKIERKRFNGNSPEAWRIRRLESLYRAELGEVSAVPAIAQMIRRAAELVLMSEKQRAKHIRTASFERLLRMEGVIGRVLDRMREMAAQARAEQSRQMIAHLILRGRAKAAEPPDTPAASWYSTLLPSRAARLP